MERTLIIFKPDAVQRGLCGEILARCLVRLQCSLRAPSDAIWKLCNSGQRQSQR